MVPGQALELMQHLNAVKEKIEQYYKRAKANPDQSKIPDKKKTLSALDVQIVAIPEEMKIHIAVPLEFITTARTLA